MGTSSRAIPPCSLLGEAMHILMVLVALSYNLLKIGSGLDPLGIPDTGGGLDPLGAPSTTEQRSGWDPLG